MPDDLSDVEDEVMRRIQACRPSKSWWHTNEHDRLIKIRDAARNNLIDLSQDRTCFVLYGEIISKEEIAKAMSYVPPSKPPLINNPFRTDDCFLQTIRSNLNTSGSRSHTVHWTKPETLGKKHNNEQLTMAERRSLGIVKKRRGFWAKLWKELVDYYFAGGL